MDLISFANSIKTLSDVDKPTDNETKSVQIVESDNNSEKPKSKNGGNKK